MRSWRCGGRPGCGIAVLSARPRHSGKPGTRPVAASLPGRRGGGNRKYRPARAGAHRTADGAEGYRMTAPLLNIPGKITMPFDAEQAKADFEILSRQVYG